MIVDYIFYTSQPAHQPLSTAQLQGYLTRIQTGGLSDAIAVYQELYDLGYKYAGWAEGVATGQSLTGVAALDYLSGTALLGLGGDACRNLTAAQIDAIRVGMAEGYVKALQQIADRNGGVATSDVDFKLTQKFHEDVFIKNGLSLDNWTLKSPMDLIRELEGYAAAEAAWVKLRDTGGKGIDGVLASAALLKKIGLLAISGDPKASDWIDKVAGSGVWAGIERGLKNLQTWIDNNLPNGNPYDTGTQGDPHSGMPWPGDGANRFGDAESTTSPLILDLNGDGVKTISQTAGKHFDHAGDGFAERTGWVDVSDGLLVRDLNKDGKISSGRELFGNHTLLSQGPNAGKEAANGFEALADLDDNGDGVVDDKDAAFASLRVWKDANGNGVTDVGELLTLAQAGVKSLTVSHSQAAAGTAIDAQGNEHQQTGSFTKTDGTAQAMHDVWFATTGWDSTDLRSPLEPSAAIEALPEIVAPGRLGSLHQAMARDSSGQLQTMVTQYTQQVDPSSRATLLQGILFRWAGVQDVDPGSRAATQIYGNVIGDARKLEFMEEYFGKEYLGTWCWGERDPNPHGPAAVKLLALYEDIKRGFATQLDAQSWDSTLYEGLELNWNEDTDSFEFDVSNVVQSLRKEYDADKSAGKTNTLQHLASFGVNLGEQGQAGEEILQALRLAGSAQGDSLSVALLQLASQRYFDGTTGNDSLSGNAKDNVFHGNAGNDTLTGGEGADTYHFSRGDGQDLILDIGAPVTVAAFDSIQFGTGITPAGLTLTRGTGVGQDDLIIDLGSGDRVTVQYYFFGADYRIERIQFADGKYWGRAEIAGNAIQSGTAGDDRIWGLADEGNRIRGLDGNDSLEGGASADILEGGTGQDILSGKGGADSLEGGAGNDVLSGGDAADTLVGGAGSDYLQGSSGNDVYVFNQGDGFDTVDDYDTSSGNADTLRLGAGLTAAAVVVRREGSDLTLSWGSMDQVRVSNFAYEAGRVERINFADGTVWTVADVALRQMGTSGDDDLTGLSGVANRMQGLAGNDTLRGFAAADSLEGGAGNDVLSGGDGADTLVGGAGSDYLQGSSGNDVYVFNQGDGFDTVDDYDIEFGNTDTLRLGAGLTAAAVVVRREGSDLTLSWGSTDQVRVSNFAYEAGRVERINFADGTVWTVADVALRQMGASGDDDLTGLSGVANRMQGLAGNDTLRGFAAADSLEGGAGNDVLYGGDGADTLVGGAGSDYLQGSSGNDVYVFNQGDGFDTVDDYDIEFGNTDTLRLGAGLTAAAVVVRREGSDLTLSWGSTDQVRVSNFAYEAGRVERINFADGTVWTVADVALRQMGTSGDDDLTGLSGVANRMQGLAGNDTLRGFAAADSLEGGAGNDVLSGGDGADTLVGGAGSDYLQGSSGNDVYVFNQGDGFDTVDDYDIEFGNTDTLRLGAGLTAAAVVVRREGSDLTLSWGSTDQVRVSNFAYEAGRVERINFADGTVWTAADVARRLAGNSGTSDLVLKGGLSKDTLTGGTGHDRLDGGPGDDSLRGGPGNDTYWVDSTADVVSENADEGTDTVLSVVTWTLSFNVENLTLSGMSAVNGTGNALSNVLTGNSAANTLNGGAGNDTLDGGAGADTCLGGADDDTYIVDSTVDVVTESANEGLDTVLSSLSWTLSANVENLRLTGSAAINGAGNALNNSLSGNNAANTLNGGPGNDTLDGGAGADTMFGGLGDDTYVVDSSADVLTENANEGVDTVFSSLSWTLAINLENLTLTGAAVINATGNALNNVLTGNSAANVLAGGAGDDTYVVDIAGDKVIESANEGTDTVLSSVSWTLGANLENLTLTGTAAIKGTGNALNNVLTGNSADNTLTGGAGNDTYVVDSEGDLVIESANEGLDTVRSSVIWKLGANLENLTLTGSAVINGTGNALSNVLIGNSAANVLDGGAGLDTMSGGAGDDSYVVDNAGEVVTEYASEGVDTVISSLSWNLGANLENLTLTGTSAINGTGNALNNVLTGNSAANVLVGGAGNDTYVVDNTADKVTENANEGTDTVRSGLNWILGSNLENLTLIGAAEINGTGNALSNVLTGNSAANILDGGLGADSLMGEAGDDIYVVDNAADVVTESVANGVDTVRSSLTWSLGANLENLTLTGVVAINATGNAQNNALMGNSAANTLDGGEGVDTMAGGAGNDTYVVDNADDIVIETISDGADTVRSSVTWTLGSNLENLTLTGATATNGTGNALDNVISGNTASNTLSGASGNDTFYDGGGADTVSGGDGEDLFRTTLAWEQNTYDGGAGRDTVDYSAQSYPTGRAYGGFDGYGGIWVDLAAGKAWRYRYGRQLYDGIPDNLVSVENARGSDLRDFLVGDAQANHLQGLAGTDYLDGGVGADTLLGGLGDDTYVVDHTADTVTENPSEGTDTVLSSLSWTLGANLENLTLTGAAAISGTGNSLNNVLTGNNSANSLTGGAGSDRFVFASIMTSVNGDTVADFSVVQNDSLALDDAVFTRLTGKTSLANHFRLSTQAAVGGDDYIVYNRATGQLSYDASGNGTGTALVFATLGNKPQDLTAAQFAVI